MSDRPFTDWQELGLPARIVAALHHEGIYTVEQLRELGPAGFCRIPNIGRISVEDVRRIVGWENKPPPEPAEPSSPSPMERIAEALERIATVMEKARRLDPRIS